jgi:cation diffusion facilitator family transporter
MLEARAMHEGHIHRHFEVHGAQHKEAAASSERRTWWVVAITAVMMVLELVVGAWSGSLALLADGVHMATHVGAIGLSGVAYWLARRWSTNEAFSFGTGKVYALAGYTSALVLAGAALWMAIEAVLRLLSPTAVRFEEALPIAALGLVVNLVCAKLLHSGDAHAHPHDHDHDHEHPHAHAHEESQKPKPVHAHVHDPNRRAAYLHVVADALTSVLAIAALVAGRYFGLKVLDPLMGIVGGAIILHWSWKLCHAAGRQLLDVAPSLDDINAMREHLEAIDDVHVADLHIWDLGPGERGCIVKLVTSNPRAAEYYRNAIKSKMNISHLTVEVQHCQEEHP